MTRICYRWVFTNVLWKNADWTWSECQIVQDILTGIKYDGVDATTLIQPWLIEPWNPYKQHDSGSLEKRKRLIKLICKVKGQTYKEEKETGTMNISVDDIKMIVKAVSNIDLDVKFEE